MRRRFFHERQRSYFSQFFLNEIHDFINEIHRELDVLQLNWHLHEAISQILLDFSLISLCFCIKFIKTNFRLSAEEKVKYERSFSFTNCACPLARVRICGNLGIFVKFEESLEFSLFCDLYRTLEKRKIFGKQFTVFNLE